jgi:glycosyltransferase involved in cell wall biosynthesis
MAEVSVVVPVFNGERTIAETLRSLRSQTFTDFEVIVVDDGSTDATVAIVEGFRGLDLRLFRFTNGGVAEARNRGIELASGGLVGFLDHDDLWAPRKLEAQVELLRAHPQAGAACSWTVNMTGDPPDRFFTQGPRPPAGCDMRRELLFDNVVGSGSNLLVRREVLGHDLRYDPHIGGCEDWDFAMQIAAGHDYVVVERNHILYRLTPDSLSRRLGFMEAGGMRMIDKVFRDIPAGLADLEPVARARYYRYLASLALRGGVDDADRSAARRYLRRAVRLHPPILRERFAQRLIVKTVAQGVLPGALYRRLDTGTRSLTTLHDFDENE